MLRDRKVIMKFGIDQGTVMKMELCQVRMSSPTLLPSVLAIL